MEENIELKPGDSVWFEPGVGFPLPGEVLEVHTAAQIIIIAAFVEGKLQTFTLGKTEGNIMLRQDLEKEGVEDLTQLEDIHEASVLWNLRNRYEASQFYTYIGSILISINPYMMHPNLYGLEMAKKYSNSTLGQLPPHLFAIGKAAYSALVNQKQNQTIVVSGESGSGKTECSKLIMQYLAAVVPGGGISSNKIAEQILEASPLLESFGNAKTTKNDNSSRFGKYLEVYFKSGSIIGAKITQYLLEKSRIVTQLPDERNYHIFYELLGGLNETERSKYGLLEADKYFYLNQGSSDCAPNGSCKEWSSLQGSMQVLGFTDQEREGINRVLASVLHIGNVYFHRRQLRNSMEGVELGSDGAECKWASHLLDVSSEDLIRSLKTRLTETRNELLYTPLTIDQALDARDAFAKAVYSGLFNWIVSRINSIIHKGGTHDAQRISILDIFGFESLEENSFEQLCINYANESLQLFFNKHVFKMEQAEYAKERLEWEPMEWEDNLPIIHLLAKKPVGIFHLLDDESNFPRASDMSFLEKCHYNHALNEIYSRPRVGANEFGITHHSSGLVWYNVEGFLEKNRDSLRPEVLALLSSSSLPVVQEMSKQMRAQREEKNLPRGSNGRFITMKPRTPTVSARFSDSLQRLLTSMSKSNPWFVRTIRPNDTKQPKKVDMSCLLSQVRSLGVLSSVNIRKKGYPVRLRFQHFVERYRFLLKRPISRGTPYRELCRQVLDSFPSNNEHDFQLGAARVFLRESLHRKLERGRNQRLHRAAIIIQRNARSVLLKKKGQSQQKSAIMIQKVMRGYVQRKRYQNMRTGIVKLQALYRGGKERKRYERVKHEMRRMKEAKQIRERAVHRAPPKAHVTEKSSIVHLDVPAELAFIFSKLDGWVQIHGDRNLVKVVGTVPGPPISAELPMELDQFGLGKFSSVYCNGIQLHPRKDPITTPFLTRTAARDKDFQDALSIFKLILRWIGDSSLDANKDKVLADYIVNKGLSSRSLRDEILVQLCNQVYGVEESQATRIWHLMSHCLSTFQPGAAFSKYLMKFIIDNAPLTQRELLLKKLLRSTSQSVRLYPPTYLEWRAAKQSDVAVGLTLPDGKLQTVAIDAWTTCEEAASLSLALIPGFQTQGWTVVLDDMDAVTDSCGLDYLLDFIGEKELCPAFPSVKNDLLRISRNSPLTPLRSPKSPNSPMEIEPLKRPINPPPAPPQQGKIKYEKAEREVQYTRNDAPMMHRKTSIDLLSRSSALNERYFETDKSRSRSLDDLMNSDTEPSQPEVVEVKQPLNELGLSGSRLNDRYHSAERLVPMKQPVPKFLKVPYTGKRTSSIHSNKYSDRPDHMFRSSGMSDTSETPSLASHVRRVRVPSQASDVDQFLDDLFSPVLDSNLDELSDARSLAASIRGNGLSSYDEAPMLDDEVAMLQDTNYLCRAIKGGIDEDEPDNLIPDASLEEYITELFQPIFLNENICNLAEKHELADTIRGGGSGANVTEEPGSYQQQAQRAFLESAMEQNIKIQQQLIAQNEALQTLLCQQDENGSNPTSQTTSPTGGHHPQGQLKTMFKFTSENNYKEMRVDNNGHFSNPPPPPPMPPPLIESDPFQRPFMDPYGRAKTVRIGKWRWPPPDNVDNIDDYIAFKMRQSHRKTTPQSQVHSTSYEIQEDSRHESRGANEWDNGRNDMSDLNSSSVEKSRERFKSEPSLNKNFVPNRVQKRSFDVGADRPMPSNVGKLKLSTEMRQRLEQVTAGHSVRSVTSNKSDMINDPPIKLDDARRMMLEQQLGASHNFSVRNQIQRMEASKIQKPFMPLPSMPAPPPPIRPNSMPPNSIPPPPPMQHHYHQKENIPSFVQRMDKDTFGIKDNYTDSWERNEKEKLDLIYDINKRSRSQSRERENFDESIWDRTEVEGPPSNDEAYKSNVRDKSRQSEMTQIQRERESALVYQPKMSEKTKKNSSTEKATFKSHMFSQKDRERKTSSSTIPSQREKYDDTDMVFEEFNSNAIPKPVLASPIFRAPSACLTYNSRIVPWKLRVKKEVFRPSESLGNTTSIDLLYSQIITDVTGPCVRISSQDKYNATNFLNNQGVDSDMTSANIRISVKRQLIEIARTWPLYFARLFIVNGSPQYPDVKVLAVHHTGVYLARKENDMLIVSKSIPFDDLQNVVTLPRPAALQLVLKDGNRYALHASKASSIHSFLQSYLHEFRTFIEHEPKTQSFLSIMSNIELHNNSYKCYDSIPTPPDGLKQPDAEFTLNIATNNTSSPKLKSNLIRSSSLDSLINSSEQDSSSELSDSDSLCELKKISSSDAHSVDKPRTSDIEQLKNVEPPKDSVRKTYLENSHRSCDYENCGFKEPPSDENFDSIEINPSPTKPIVLPPPPVVIKVNRRSSVVNLDPRMETIPEEPNESKVLSVKEILARFETLRETSETHSKGSAISSGVKAAAATLNVSVEKLETNNSQSYNGNKDAEQTNGVGNRKRSDESTYHHQKQFMQQQTGNGHQQQQQEAIINRQEESSPTQTSVVKHSLLQFALQHFRYDSVDEPSKNRSEKRGPYDRFHANLVKWQGVPLQAPLLKLPADLNGLALECFECILRYCGDMPQDHNFSEVKCVYTVLMHCHKYLILRDEVYCQLMKQTTANRSSFPDSSQRAWRLLSILAAYFGCSEALKPYLIEHLTSAASDRRGTAQVCLTNLRKTARCGGRKNVPSVEEVTAVSAGRSARRQIYRLPGGAERVVNTRCSTVVADVIYELCSLLGIETESEQQEFSLYCIVQGDAFTMPLSSDEYILDVTTELLKTNQPFYLIFCRSVWHFPLKKDPTPTPLYIEVLFNQVAPDYLEGLLLEMPNMGTPSPDYIKDIGRIAAILHRAADLNHIPVMKEIKFLLPKPALGLREIKPAQWVNLVQAEFVKVLQLTPLQCKAQFLNVLSSWPLFGSSFFAVKRVFGDDIGIPEEENAPIWRELILALNHRGVLFLNSNTHETLHHWQFIEIISTRKVRSEDALFLDMKVGNLLQQNVIRVQTEQAHEISRIIRQYISMASQKDRRE